VNSQNVDEICVKAKEEGATQLNISFRGVHEIPHVVFTMGEHLTRLVCAGNKVEKIPSSIQNLTNLSSLLLGSNELRSLPEAIGNLPNLTILSLGENSIESIPRSIKTLTNLTELTLNRNPLTTLPQEVGLLQNLTILRLQLCKLTSLPDELSSLINLKELNASGNELHNHIPSFIFGLSNLETLDLHFNKLTSLLPRIRNSKNNNNNNNNNSVDSNFCDQNGASSSEIKFFWSGLPKLKRLVLSENIITEISPNTISFATNLDTLDLSYNQIAKIASDIKSLTSLSYLDLSTNNLSSIPVELNSLINLVYIDLSYNDLTEFPDFNNFFSLRRIVISGNRATDYPMLAELRKKGVQAIGDTKENEANLILPKLWLGNACSAKNKWKLKELGVTHVLTIAEHIPPQHPRDFEYKIISVDDHESVDLLKHLPDCKTFIDKGRQQGGVLVHCAAGVSRSASMCIMYIMLEKGMPNMEAFEFVRDKRPIICPNSGFRDQIHKLEENMKNNKNGDKCIVS